MFRFGDDKQSFTCSFCGKKQEQVRRMIAGPGVYICSDCVDMCKDIIAEELSKDEAEGDGKLPKPKEIMDILNRYVIGQEKAKKILAVAVYNQFMRSY